MIEFTKIFCDLHPNELVSNYCAHCTCITTQNNATWLSAQLASARIPNPTSREEVPPTMRTSGPPILKCRIASGHAYLLFSIRNRELYSFCYPRILSSKIFIRREKALLSLSCRQDTKLLTSSTNSTTRSRRKCFVK